MNRRIVLGAMLGLSPLAAMGQHPPDSPEGPPVRVTAVTSHAGHLAGPPQAPFGYFPTRWRAFPVAEIVVSKPATIIPKADEKSPEKPPEKKIEPPAPPSVKQISATAAGRFATQPAVAVEFVPVPHPASPAGRPVPRNEKGFASLRTEAHQSAETSPRAIPAPIRTETPPVANQPKTDSGLRSVRGDDEVARPEWPKLPPVKK